MIRQGIHTVKRPACYEHVTFVLPPWQTCARCSEPQQSQHQARLRHGLQIVIAAEPVQRVQKSRGRKRRVRRAAGGTLLQGYAIGGLVFNLDT